MRNPNPITTLKRAAGALGLLAILGGSAAAQNGQFFPDGIGGYYSYDSQGNQTHLEPDGMGGLYNPFPPPYSPPAPPPIPPLNATQQPYQPPSFNSAPSYGLQPYGRFNR